MFLSQLQLLSAIDLSPLPKPDPATVIPNVISVVLAIAGAIDGLIMTIAGYNYIIARGEPQAVAKARDTIIYGLVGLVIIITSFSIITFVVNGLK